MQDNLESKLTAHGTKPLGLWGGQAGLEKHTKQLKDWQPCSGAGYFVFKVFKVNSQTFILLWCKKCEKLEKEVILVQRSVSTINVCKKNEQNRPILSENDKKTENEPEKTIAENRQKKAGHHVKC